MHTCLFKVGKSIIFNVIQSADNVKNRISVRYGIEASKNLFLHIKHKNDLLLNSGKIPLWVTG